MARRSSQHPPIFTRLYEPPTRSSSRPPPTRFLRIGLPDRGHARGCGALLPISLRGKLMGMSTSITPAISRGIVDAAQALNAVGCWLIDTLHHRSTVTFTDARRNRSLAAATPQQHPNRRSLKPRSKSYTDGEEIEPGRTGPEQSPNSAYRTGARRDRGTARGLNRRQRHRRDGSRRDRISSGNSTSVQPKKRSNSTTISSRSRRGAEMPPGRRFDPSATIRVEVTEEAGTIDFEPAAEQSFPPPAAEPEPAARRPEIRRRSWKHRRRFGRSNLRSSRHRPRRSLPAATRRRGPARGSPPIRPAPGFRDQALQRGRSRRGRAAKDLGNRLKEDIERSREMFEKRISPEIRRARLLHR